MSIDARVTAVTYSPDGTATLHLEPADPRRAPAGQPSLVVLNPRPGMGAMVGTQVWGGAGEIMVGDTKFADRVGYTRIRLVEPKGGE